MVVPGSMLAGEGGGYDGAMAFTNRTYPCSDSSCPSWKLRDRVRCWEARFSTSLRVLLGGKASGFCGMLILGDAVCEYASVIFFDSHDSKTEGLDPSSASLPGKWRELEAAGELALKSFLGSALGVTA